MTADLSVLVLAGGAARRLGGRKADRRVGDRRLVDQVVDVARKLSDDVILLPGDRRLDVPGTRKVPDAQAIDGPLSGLLAGLTTAQRAWSLLLPCDMPQVSARVVRRLLAAREGDAEAIVVHDGQRLQPFHGLYHRDLVTRLGAYLSAGGRSLTGLLERVRLAGHLRGLPLALLGEDADGRFLRDIDTPDALRRLRRARARAVRALTSERSQP